MKEGLSNSEKTKIATKLQVHPFLLLAEYIDLCLI
jgi:hypothetical protein